MLLQLGFTKKSSVSGHLNYLEYLLRHKYNIYDAGRELDVGRWQLIKHDMDKFYPSIWSPYEQYWSEGKRDDETKLKFRKAVSIHKGRNPHHKKIKNVQTQLESVADWYATAKTRAQMGNKSFPSFKDWYLKHLYFSKTNPKTVELIVDKLQS